MRMKRFVGFGVLVAAACALAACGDSSSGSAPASGASGAATSKPTAAATATATATAAAATATATATAAAAAPGKIMGIADGEMLAASCDTIDKDSECGEVVVKSEADKAKTAEALKQFCKGKLGESACSTTNMVGTCRVMKDVINHYFSDGPKKYDADSAKKACEKQHGRWVTP